MTGQADEDAIVVESELDAPPDKVWRALTEPGLVDAWLPAAVPGGTVERRVLEARPPEFLRLGWRVGGALDSRVTFELEPLDAARTRLRIVHDGFRPLPAANRNTPPLALAA